MEYHLFDVVFVIEGSINNSCSNSDFTIEIPFQELHHAAFT
jgi:hypothetical protein